MAVVCCQFTARMHCSASAPSSSSGPTSSYRTGAEAFRYQSPAGSRQAGPRTQDSVSTVGNGNAFYCLLAPQCNASPARKPDRQNPLQSKLVHLCTSPKHFTQAPLPAPAAPSLPARPPPPACGAGCPAPGTPRSPRPAGGSRGWAESGLRGAWAGTARGGEFMVGLFRGLLLRLAGRWPVHKQSGPPRRSLSTVSQTPTQRGRAALPQPPFLCAQQ